IHPLTFLIWRHRNILLEVLQAYASPKCITWSLVEYMIMYSIIDAHFPDIGFSSRKTSQGHDSGLKLPANWARLANTIHESGVAIK
ncbi:MAG: hypothetical protein P8166_15605, partial [Candidatus Thiodiazotropha sp.]